MPGWKKMYGTPEGQHRLLGVGDVTPDNAMSPRFFTIAAASGFSMGVV
jgi:hypothetical protein